MPKKVKNPKFVIFQDAAGEFRWRFKAKNGKIMADSGESYTLRKDCEIALYNFIEIVAKEFIDLWCPEKWEPAVDKVSPRIEHIYKKGGDRQSS